MMNAFALLVSALFAPKGVTLAVDGHRIEALVFAGYASMVFHR